MALRALIFDVDGTLADTERDGHRIAFNRAFSDAGLDWHWDVPIYGELLRVAGGRERLLHFIQSGNIVAPTTDIDALIDDLHARKTRHYLRLVEEGEIRLRPGVHRLLKEAHDADIALAIATTTSRVNVDALLTRALPRGAADWFAVIAAAEDAPRKKPDPSVYRVALERLGVEPTHCIAVEDSEAGLRSSLAAGVPTLVTLNDYTRNQDFSGSISVISDLGDAAEPLHVIAGAKPERGLIDLEQLRKWI